MSKSKRARSIKPRAGFKTRSKLARKVAGQHHRGAHSKQARVLTLLRRHAAAGRHGSQPGTAMNDAPVQLRTVAPA